MIGYFILVQRTTKFHVLPESIYNLSWIMHLGFLEHVNPLTQGPGRPLVAALADDPLPYLGIAHAAFVVFETAPEWASAPIRGCRLDESCAEIG